jgi:hypothetical protein
MIFESPSRVHLTRRELNELRQRAAASGHCVNQVRTPAQLLQAVLDALPIERQADLLAFLANAHLKTADRDRP